MVSIFVLHANHNGGELLWEHFHTPKAQVSNLSFCCMNKEFAYIASMKNFYFNKTKTNLLTNKLIFISVIKLHEDLPET